MPGLPGGAHERLRDAIGSVRALYAGARDARSCPVLCMPAEGIATALEVADRPDLQERFDVLPRELDAAVQAGHSAAPALLGAIRRV